MKHKWERIAKVIGTGEIESTADGVFLSEEQMDTLQTHLARSDEDNTKHLATIAANGTAQTTLQTAHNALVIKITALEGQVNTLTTASAAKDTQITELTAKVVKLPVNKDKPAATGAEVAADGEKKYSWTETRKQKRAEELAARES